MFTCLGCSEATRDSQAVKALQNLKDAGYVVTAHGESIAMQPEYINYLLRTEELWARTYAQYIATKSDDTTLMQQLRLQQLRPIPAQWGDEDFLPIMQAIDELFRTLSWI